MTDEEIAQDWAQVEMDLQAQFLQIMSGGTVHVAIHRPTSLGSPNSDLPLIADALAAFESMDGFKGMQVESATLVSECPAFDLKEGNS